jgi:hypothetical protein
MNRINKQGYIEVFIENDWVLEHRYVVEKFLKRKLKTEEVVHHLSGNKWENHIDNLMLFSNQKAHQSFHNKIKKDGWTRYRIEQVKNRWNND